MPLKLDDAVQSHEAIRIIYVVDGYHAELWTRDEARLVALASGVTIVDAIAALEQEIEHVETLKHLRALPSLALYGAGADNKKPPHQSGG